jgi:hypothetical protein
MTTFICLLLFGCSKLHPRAPTEAAKRLGKIRENFWQKCYIATRILEFSLFMKPIFAITGPLVMCFNLLINYGWIGVQPERVAYFQEKVD